MKLMKRNGKFYLRLYRGYRQDLIPTHKSTEREAKKSAERILAMFEREKATRSLSEKLCRYAVELAKGKLTKRELRDPLAALEQQAMNQAVQIIEEIFPSPGLMADELWENYIEVAPKIKDATMKTKYQRWMKFQEWAGTMDMRNFSESDARRFLESRDCAAQTWNNYISDISSVFAVYTSINNPWGQSLRKDATNEHEETVPFTIEQAKKVLEYCDSHNNELADSISIKRWGQFIRALYYTGQRPVDVCHLERSEIKDGTIDLMPDKTSRTRRKVSYKADPQLLKMLSEISDDGTGLYFSEFAKKYDKNRANLNPGFQLILKRCGLYGLKLSLYGFRHLFVTYQINSGKDDETVASAVGHTSTQTTKDHYYHGKQNVVLTDMPII